MSRSTPAHRFRVPISLLLTLLAWLMMTGSAHAATCTVPTDHATINAALADAACSDIHLLAGTYDESLDITRSVTITGAGAASTLIAPTSKPPTIVRVEGAATDAEISGVTIRYASGFYPTNGSAVQVIGVHVTGNAHASIHDSIVTEIHDVGFTGNQVGRCIVVGGDASQTLGNGLGPGTAEITNNQISYCQKNSIDVRGVGSSAQIVGNTVRDPNRGDGKLPSAFFYSGNGIAIVNAHAQVSDNLITGFTCNDMVDTPTCNPSFPTSNNSVGIVLSATDATTTVSGNEMTGDDVGFADQGAAPGVTNVWTGNYAHDNIHANGMMSSTHASMSDNRLMNAPYGLVMGNYAAMGAPGAVHLDGGNRISGSSIKAIYMFDSGSVSGGTTLDGSRNDLSGNAGMFDVRTAGRAYLPCNWWGAVSGPQQFSNPLGTGSSISDGALTSPFSLSPTTFECGASTLGLQLTFDHVQIYAGAKALLTWQLSASGAEATSDIAATFNLPAGLTMGGIDMTDCTGTVAPTPGGFTLTGGSLAADASCRVRMSVGTGELGRFQAVASLSSVTSLRGGLLDMAQAPLRVIARPIPGVATPDLAVTPHLWKTHFRVGEKVPLAIDVTNRGKGASARAVLYVHLTGHLSAYRFLTRGIFCQRMNDLHVMACKLPAMDGGAHQTISFVVKVRRIGQVLGFANVVMRGEEPDSGDYVKLRGQVAGAQIQWRRSGYFAVRMTSKAYQDTSIYLNDTRVLQTSLRNFTYRVPAAFLAKHPHPAVRFTVRHREVPIIVARFHLGVGLGPKYATSTSLLRTQMIG